MLGGTLGLQAIALGEQCILPLPGVDSLPWATCWVVAFELQRGTARSALLEASAGTFWVIPCGWHVAGCMQVVVKPLGPSHWQAQPQAAQLPAPQQ